jgi:hypothetical protein
MFGYDIKIIKGTAPTDSYRPKSLNRNNKSFLRKLSKKPKIQRPVLRGGRHFLLDIAQIVAGLHVEVKHRTFYPVAVGALGTD